LDRAALQRIHPENVLMPTAVLVVDDDDDIRDVLRALLEDEGYSVDEARNGAEALRMLRSSSQRFVVLLDLRMPVLDGVAVVSTIAREKPLRTRHAYILATADNRTLPLAFAQQLTSLEIPVLSKPFEERKLFALVSAASSRLNDR
jgi:CheY-like chemotaxis protein